MNTNVTKINFGKLSLIINPFTKIVEHFSKLEVLYRGTGETDGRNDPHFDNLPPQQFHSLSDQSLEASSVPL
jgi:hypothetical protein